jgi:ubiquinol-cytochrome c reductase cytochrome b subunit
VEARVSGDTREHHLLNLPWEAPLRLAIGCGALTFFVVLTLAGANDVLAVLFNVDVGALTTAFRALLVLGPLVVGLFAYRLAVEIRARSGRPLGPEGGSVIRRTDDGGFEEVEP